MQRLTTIFAVTYESTLCKLKDIERFWTVLKVRGSSNPEGDAALEDEEDCRRDNDVRGRFHIWEAALMEACGPGMPG